MSTHTPHRVSTRAAAATVRPSRLAGQVVAGRELAALVDGPWSPRWYWRSDLEAMQHAGRRHPDGHPAAELRRYAPTDRFCDHPGEPDVTGRVWRYRLPVPAPRGALP